MLRTFFHADDVSSQKKVSERILFMTAAAALFEIAYEQFQSVRKDGKCVKLGKWVLSDFNLLQLNRVLSLCLYCLDKKDPSSCHLRRVSGPLRQHEASVLVVTNDMSDAPKNFPEQ
ncbi:unnamed protein product [Haemonchus placei]|uniref:NR LBD domain-containing protein n=1 Tax=Haemonchus placei TaxID=6290 RepID=A0A0N4X3A7_HAEPC|nr:unnamed protein product [Haemonchus placei]